MIKGLELGHNYPGQHLDEYLIMRLFRYTNGKFQNGRETQRSWHSRGISKQKPRAFIYYLHVLIQSEKTAMTLSRP